MLASTRTLAVALATLVLAGVAVAAVPAAPGLDATERATLLSMREEEKLAHDVYLALAATTGAPVFKNIAASELRHERAVERALAAYGIADPTDGDAAGRFPSQRFQELYDRLVAEGSASRAAAFSVGVQIETLDISDLRTATRQTDEPMLDRVYENLLAGSQRHLRAFEAEQSGTSAGVRSQSARPARAGACRA